MAEREDPALAAQAPLPPGASRFRCSHRPLRCLHAPPVAVAPGARARQCARSSCGRCRRDVQGHTVGHARPGGDARRAGWGSPRAVCRACLAGRARRSQGCRAGTRPRRRRRTCTTRPSSRARSRTCCASCGAKCACGGRAKGTGGRCQLHGCRPHAGRGGGGCAKPGAEAARLGAQGSSGQAGAAGQRGQGGDAGAAKSREEGGGGAGALPAHGLIRAISGELQGSLYLS